MVTALLKYISHYILIIIMTVLLEYIDHFSHFVIMNLIRIPMGTLHIAAQYAK